LNFCATADSERETVDAETAEPNNRSMTIPIPDSSIQSSSFPVRGALMGLDYGSKRLGIAVCNMEQTVAVPVETWLVRTPAVDLKHLKTVIEDYRIAGIVIGLPMRLDGIEGDQAAVVRRFGTWLAEGISIPITYWDERHSSTEAEVLLWSQGVSPTKSKEKLDRLAAQVILQSYLDATNRDRPAK